MSYHDKLLDIGDLMKMATLVSKGGVGTRRRFKLTESDMCLSDKH